MSCLSDDFIESVINYEYKETEARNLMTVHREFRGMEAVASDDECNFDPDEDGGEDE